MWVFPHARTMRLETGIDADSCGCVRRGHDAMRARPVISGCRGPTAACHRARPTVLVRQGPISGTIGLVPVIFHRRSCRGTAVLRGVMVDVRVSTHPSRPPDALRFRVGVAQSFGHARRACLGACERPHGVVVTAPRRHHSVLGWQRCPKTSMPVDGRFPDCPIGPLRTPAVTRRQLAHAGHTLQLARAVVQRAGCRRTSVLLHSHRGAAAAGWTCLSRRLPHRLY